MANKWIDYVYNETDYRGSDLAVAQKLADAANRETDKCQMKIETLSSQTRLSIRQVKRVLANLEKDGFLEIKRYQGRGLHPEFQLKKVTSATPFRSRKKVTFEAIKGDKKVTSATVKGDICDREKVTSATRIYKEEPLREPFFNPEEGNPHALASVSDELAIQAVEKAFAIRLDLQTQRLVTEAVPPNLIDRFPAYISGRAVGWANKSPSEKLAKIGYALTDFQKENNGNSATNRPSFQQVRERQAIADRQLIDGIRARVSARKLSGSNAGDSGGKLRSLVAKPDDG